MNKRKIFLGDLVHDWEKISVWTLPLNIGFIASYAQKILGPDVEFSLFKRPAQMIDAIMKEKPDVVGLSYYVWNENLNARIFGIAKGTNPSVLTIGGGPHFTNLNINQNGAQEFFDGQQNCDAYVFNQGEQGFAGALKIFFDGHDLERFKYAAIPGLITNLAGDGFHVGAPLDALVDLDDIPSPYLNGMLDPFFSEPMSPLIETNRSCPYRCTFCAWGIGTTKLSRFSDQRIFDEIDYICQRCTKAVSLFFCDANYGILDRDESFARRLHDNKSKYGFPGNVFCQWNKSQPQRVMRVVKAFYGLAPLGASCQTLHKPTLDAIKRVNLPLEKITEMAAELKKIDSNYTMFSELILGLPLETKQSHLDSNKQLLDAGVETIHNYNLHLLPGTEMYSTASRQKYFKKTAYRLHDNCWGEYADMKVFEAQEVVVETSTMAMADLRGFRFIHFLIQFMWSKRFYSDFLTLQREAGIHPIDFIVKVVDACAADPGDIGTLYGRFCSDHDLEVFATPEELFAYWSQAPQFERLKSGDYGKLNFQYTFVILLEHRMAFDAILRSVCRTQLSTSESPSRDEYLCKCDEVLQFNRARTIKFAPDLTILDSMRESFVYDILTWKLEGCANSLIANPSCPGGFCYEFYLPTEKKDYLEGLLKQYAFRNTNMTLRKMSEYSSTDNMFYDVRVAQE